MKLRYYQRDAIDSLYKYLETNDGNALIVLPTGCHAKGTGILMFDGTIKNVEDVRVGDFLMGDNSEPRKVLRLARGKENLYKITPIKGESFIVNEGHILSLQSTNEGKIYHYKNSGFNTTGKEIINISVKEYLEKSKSWKHLYKLRRVPVFFGNDRVPHPYLVGLFLGDGHIKSSSITTMDTEIKEYCRNIAQEMNCFLREVVKPNNKASALFFTSLIKRGKISINPMKRFLSAAGIVGKADKKFIPHAYKTSCLEDRLQILAGLLDSDGSLTCGGYDYISKSERLADDVCFIARSCGLAAYKSESRKCAQNKIYKTYYRVSISGNCSVIPCKIERKKAPHRQQKKSPLVTGFSVEPAGYGDFFGFELDKNHLYLTSDFTVHHNTGKSLVIAQVIEELTAQWPSTRILIATHSKELVSQNYSEFINLSPFAPAGIFSAGLNRRDSDAQILFCGIQSIYRRAYDIQRCDILLIDEAHTISQKGSGMWHQFITEITKINHDVRIVGLTATDYRLDSGLLTTGENKIFDDVCYEYGLLQAIKDGYLCPIIPASMATRFDLSGVGTRMGEWKQDELESAINIDSITRKAIDEIEAYGQDRKSWLIFACGNKHAEAIHLELKRRGYDGACVTEKTKKGDRDAAVSNIRTGKIRYLVNNVIFTTGFNAPNIDLIADLAPTKSPGRHVQKAGRGTRCIGANIEESIANGKRDCLLLDFARNVDYHGPLDKIRGKDKTKGEGGDAPMKVCPECHQVCFAGLRKCFVCGYEFPSEGPDIRSHGGDAAVLSTQIEPTWYTVNEMYLNRHAKEGKIPSMRVDYYDFAQGKVSEWICFEHKGLARQKAEKWHRVRLYDQPVPNVVDDAITLPYPKPSKILVRWEGKYARVIDYDFRIDEKEEERSHDVYSGQEYIKHQDDEEYYEIPF